jgi:hypothetical protein
MSVIVSEHSPTHIVWPGGHVHLPCTHVAIMPQGWLQPPQLKLSLCGSMQAWLQYILSAGQRETQAPAEQRSLNAHVAPQPPQFWLSL